MAEFKTYAKKAGEVEHRWVLVDASGIPLGRLASFVASRLTGKYDPGYTPHMDSGDYVVVINADKISYGGDRTSEMLERSVSGMLPKNKLRSERLARLRVFASSEHDHLAQQPKKVEVK